MKPNIRTSSERETLVRSGKLVISTPPEDSSYLYDHDDKNDDNMNEVDDELFALPQKFSRDKYVIVDYNNNYASDSLISPPLTAHEDEEYKDVLQDFNNRDKKVQELITLNKQDFEKVKQSFNSSEEEWKRFLRVLYAKYEIVPDREWFSTLCEFIGPTNPLLLKFEELVSDNLLIETTNEEEVSYGATPYQTSEIDDDTYSSYNSMAIGSRRESRDDDFMKLQDVDIKVIRNYPEKLLDFENAYPDFFTNLRICFGQDCRRLIKHLQDNNNFDDSNTDCGENNNGDYNENFIGGLRANIEDHRQACENSELYDRFVQMLLTPRRMMPDDLWEEAIYECLDDWPHLIDQLKDIIAYEVYDENINGDLDDSDCNGDNYYKY